MTPLKGREPEWDLTGWWFSYPYASFVPGKLHFPGSINGPFTGPGFWVLLHDNERRGLKGGMWDVDLGLTDRHLVMMMMPVALIPRTRLKVPPHSVILQAPHYQLTADSACAYKYPPLFMPGFSHLCNPTPLARSCQTYVQVYLLEYLRRQFQCK